MRFRIAIVVAGLALPCATAHGFQTPAASTFTIAKMDATGVKRYSVAEVTRVSGLATGGAISISDIDAAASKMAATGLFTDVRYRYTTAGRQITIIFEVAEASWDVPVVYDNFVWFTDEELTRAVREAVPSYDATAPAGGGVTDMIAGALGRALATRGLPGIVDYKPSSRLDGSGREHIFSIKNPAPKTCDLRVNGRSAVPEAAVMAIGRSLVGMDYSRHYVSDYARLSLIQPYRSRGFWRAAFHSPTATLGRSAGCDGVVVAIQVDEGAAYAWDHAEWIGNTAIAARDLDAMLGFKAGEVADGTKLDAGLRAISVAHGKLGFLGERATAEPVLDDAGRRATFRITVTEGPLFHMGTFDITGLSPKDTDGLKKKWKLKPGDVFDASYMSEFEVKELRPFTGAGRLPVPQLAADPATHIVSVVYVFKS